MKPYWAIDKFANAVARLCRTAAHPAAVGVAELLESTTGTVPLGAEPGLPVLAHLDMTIAAMPGDGPLQSLGSEIRLLGWTELWELPPTMWARHANLECVGPDGAPIVDSQYRFGLYLQAPHTWYPRHWHAAEEFYLVLNGAADWGIGSAPATMRRSGDLIRHAPGEPHSMRTSQEPLLTAWVWVGNVDSATYRIELD